MGIICSTCCKFRGDDVSLPRPPPPLSSLVGIDLETVPLIVKDFDFNVKENCTEHRTNEFSATKRGIDPMLVVRRGQKFTVLATFSRPHDLEKDAISLVLVLKDVLQANGSRSYGYNKGTAVLLPVTFNGVNQKENWSVSAILAADNNNTLAIQVTPPADTIIGEWNLDIDTKFKDVENIDLGDNQSLAYRNSIHQPIIILFNPWCKDDGVYMNYENWKNEYLLNDMGVIWRGTQSNIRKSPWIYGQFEDNVLESCLYALSKVGKLSINARNDPVKVARHISAIVNVQDDGGIVVGNWTGKYNGGSPPTKWAGSTAILQQFYRTKKPVKYGQCWVFAGVVTTVCRALGIPSRIITNFSSAHDTHSSMTVDYFFNDDGDGIDKLNVDSIWNFHVWNEVWMKRPDLEPGDYGGWQAIDATPQESSDGLYRCGPAPVKAVKNGETLKGFDVGFLYSEVNADKIYWRYNGPTKPLKMINKEQHKIGMLMSTKSIGKYDREDVTATYKYKEYTSEERKVMMKALQQSSSLFSRYYLNKEFEDVEFNFNLKDDVLIGSDFKVQLAITNKSSDKKYSVRATTKAATMLYNGKIGKLVKAHNFMVDVAPNSVENCEMDVTYYDYETKLLDQSAFNISALCKVLESDFEFFAQDDFRMIKPDIDIKVDDKGITESVPFEIVCSFTNPLPKKLTRGMFMLEGLGLGHPVQVKLKRNVEPDQQCRISYFMTAKLAGSKTIVAKFFSKELDDVEGHKEIFVLKKNA